MSDGRILLDSLAEQRDYERGVNAYVVKPVEFEKFINAVRQLRLIWMLLNEPPP